MSIRHTLTVSVAVLTVGCGGGSTVETIPTLPPVPAPPTTRPVPVPVVTVTVTATRGQQQQVETTTTIPEPRRWNGPIPAFYGGDTGCTPDEADIVARAMWSHGAVDESVEWMLEVISRESTCDPAAHNGNRGTGDDSWGLCQQNVLAGWFNPGGLLAEFDRYRFAVDFEHNAESCAVMWARCGRGPWTKGDYGCRVPVELR